MFRTLFATTMLLGYTVQLFAQSKAPNEESKIDTSAIEKITAKATFKVEGAKATFTDRISVSVDGKRLAITLKDSKVHVYDISIVMPKLIFETSGSVGILSPSGKRLCTVNGNNAKVFDVVTKKEIAKFDAKTLLNAGQFRDENGVVLWENRGSRIEMLEIAKSKNAGSFDLPESKYQAANIANQGKSFVLLNENTGIEVETYDLTTKKQVSKSKLATPTGKQPLTSLGLYVSFANDGSVFSMLVPGGYYVFVSKDGSVAASIDYSKLGVCPAPSLHGETLLSYATEKLATAAGLKKDEFVIYNWKLQKVTASLTGHSDKAIETISARSGDGKTLVTLGQSGQCCIFDLSQLK